MKTLLTIALALLAAPGFTQQPDLYWSSPIDVASASSYGDLGPSIALTEDDVPVVLWGKLSGELYVSRLQGSSFSTPVRITPHGVQAFTFDWASPNVATFGDNVFVAYKAKPETTEDLWFVKSTDGGLTFGSPVLVDNGWSRFAAVAAQADGNPLVTFMQFDSGFVNPRHVLAYSQDGGASFGLPVDASAISPGEVCDCCQAIVLSGNGNDVVVYRGNDNNIRDTWVSKTTNKGTSFAEADIDETNWFNASCPGSGPGAMMTQDSVIAAWMSSSTGQARVVIGTVSISDMQPGFNMTRDGISGNPNQDAPTLCGNQDTVGLFWEEIANGNRDVLMSYSISGAAGLNDTVINVSNAAGSQYDVTATYANGTFHMVYTDKPAGKVFYKTASFDMVSGIEAPGHKALALYPNPATEVITIGGENILRTSLIDASGRSLMSTSSNILDLSPLQSGVYFVRVETEEGVEVGKVVKP